MDFSEDRGAVTAEFMLLFPTVIVALAGALTVFQLGLDRLELSRLAFFQARSLAIGGELSSVEGVRFTPSDDGRMLCVEATKTSLFRLSESGCYLKHGS
ncbi:hypothetical protein HRU87_05545 [Aquiluna borgnonia]|uniref:TadE-like protein n=1 Tax=Aquiluna borgnonia TaxID=2499157 RepID=A0A7D4TJF9_9MICO|nr:hypothetical protein [Aquiluna borgnonia]QKJ25631.1 hypothetical protein HRU87_05545 [Aquiluna borgnonia]